MNVIRSSVGRGGINSREDVLQVQRLLNAHLARGEAQLQVDGFAGPFTAQAIDRFQRNHAGIIHTDGLVEPGGRTIRALTRSSPTSSHGTARSSAVSAAGTPRPEQLSGAKWWYANQARYPNSSSLNDLAVGFRENAGRFIAALRAAGASVRVSATRRNRVRAHLMHYSWKVAHGQISPEDVPAIDGCDIVWDHGDVTTSREAARAMVRLFHIVYKPSLTSNHIDGTAVDMTITRPDTMSIVDGTGEVISVKTNAALHQVGASYGVRKLASDPPHWSANGR